MAKLPEHSWIRISKAFQIVMDTSEANYFDVEASLVSAFRDEAIRTRARSKRYFKHETQTQIGGDCWDRARVAWDENWFLSPVHRQQLPDESKVDLDDMLTGRPGGHHKFEDVDGQLNRHARAGI